MQLSFTSDLYSPKNSKIFSQKAHFVVGFQKFLDHALLHPKGGAPIFGQMKGLMEIYNPVKFISIAFVVVKL